MSLKNIKIWVSPMTNIIYAGYEHSGVAVMKIDVTQQVKNAMMQYMHQTSEELECLAGSMKFNPCIESNEQPSEAVAEGEV